MEKVTITAYKNGDYYDEKGIKITPIGSTPHAIGEKVYVDNSFIFGRVNNGQNHILYTPGRLEGAPLFVGTDGTTAPPRVIPPVYYQKNNTYYGESLDASFYLNLDFELVDNHENIPGDANRYLNRGLYNTENKLIKKYSKLDLDDHSRLITMVDNNEVIQTGLLKCSTGNNIFAVENCEYLIMDKIEPYEKEFTIVNSNTYTSDKREDFLYKSIRTDTGSKMPDTSTIFEGESVLSLAATYGKEVVECGKAIELCESDFLKIMNNYGGKADGVPVFPDETLRPRPATQVVYWGLTDSKGERIDDRLKKNGDLEQYSNLKIQYIGLEPLTVILYIEFIGICYPYLKHSIYDGSQAQEWIPMKAHGLYTIALTPNTAKIIKKDIESVFLYHNLFSDPTSLASGAASLAGTDTTPWEKENIKIGEKSYDVKKYRLGSLNEGADNSAPLKMTVTEECKINLVDGLIYNLSNNKIYFDDKPLISVNGAFTWGCSHYKNDLILLVNSDVYRIREGEILKHREIKLTGEYKAYGITNLNICFTKKLGKISEEV